MRSLAFLSVFLFILALAGYPQHVIHGDGSHVTVTRALSSFDKVHNSISAEVVVVKGDKYEATLEGESNIVGAVVIEVEGGALKIHFPEFTQIRSNHGLHIRITTPGELSEIANSGSGGIRVDDLFKSSEMRVRNSGSGVIRVELATDRLEMSMSGSGQIMIKGHAKQLECSISGSGSLRGSDLAIEEHAEIHISGSGSCTVTTKGVLDGSISGSGGINYLGDPSAVNVSHSGSGRARKIS